MIGNILSSQSLLLLALTLIPISFLIIILICVFWYSCTEASSGAEYTYLNISLNQSRNPALSEGGLGNKIPDAMDSEYFVACMKHQRSGTQRLKPNNDLVHSY